jgi:hypothetical protein
MVGGYVFEATSASMVCPMYKYAQAGFEVEIVNYRTLC